jgi:hypothetical protein
MLLAHRLALLVDARVLVLSGEQILEAASGVGIICRLAAELATCHTCFGRILQIALAWVYIAPALTAPSRCRRLLALRVKAILPRRAAGSSLHWILDVVVLELCCVEAFDVVNANTAATFLTILEPINW